MVNLFIGLTATLCSSVFGHGEQAESVNLLQSRASKMSSSLEPTQNSRTEFAKCGITWESKKYVSGHNIKPGTWNQAACKECTPGSVTTSSDGWAPKHRIPGVYEIARGTNGDVVQGFFCWKMPDYTCAPGGNGVTSMRGVAAKINGKVIKIIPSTSDRTKHQWINSQQCTYDDNGCGAQDVANKERTFVGCYYPNPEHLGSRNAGYTPLHWKRGGYLFCVDDDCKNIEDLTMGDIGDGLFLNYTSRPKWLTCGGLNNYAKAMSGDPNYKHCVDTNAPNDDGVMFGRSDGSFVVDWVFSGDNPASKATRSW